MHAADAFRRLRIGLADPRLRLAGMVVGLPLGIIAINRYGYQVSAVFSVAQRVKRS